MIFSLGRGAPLIRNRTIIALGDSYTFGSNASPITNSYINRMSTDLGGISVKNMAIGGRGAYNQSAALNAYNLRDGFSKPVSIITAMFGFNDMRRAGNNAKTIKKVEAGYRSVMINGMLNTPVFPGNTVTKTGGISSFDCTTYGGRSSNGASSTGSDSWTWTFEGTEFGVQFIASDGVAANYGTAKVYVDNVLVATIDTDNWYDGVNDGDNANDRGPLAFTYHNFSHGSHTVRVDSQADGRVVVDFFATFLQPAFCSAFLFWEIPYMTSTGYAIPPANLGSTAISDTYSAVISGLVTELKASGRRAAYVLTNSYYVIPTDVDVDDVHPNNTGHLHLKTAALDVLNPLGTT